MMHGQQQRQEEGSLARTASNASSMATVASWQTSWCQHCGTVAGGAFQHLLGAVSDCIWNNQTINGSKQWQMQQ